jgi:hypothetical protein
MFLFYMMHLMMHDAMLAIEDATKTKNDLVVSV